MMGEEGGREGGKQEEKEGQKVGGRWCAELFKTPTPRKGGEGEMACK